MLDIKPSYATCYPVYLLDRRRTLFKRPPVRRTTRALSHESRKLLMCAVNWLILFSPVKKFYDDKRKRWLSFRINFITLTLACPQEVNDEYMKNRLLQPFLKWLIRKGATAYIWKSETQNNGNIHFHITTNHYIDKYEIRDKWNQLQDSHGFLNDYILEHGTDSPNSTDVHGVYKHADMINNIGSYFGKLDEWCHKKGERIKKDYINHPSKWFEACEKDGTKFPLPKRQVHGRKWAVSNNLTNIKCYVDDESFSGLEFESIFNHFMSNTEHETIERDFADIYIYDENKLFSNIHPILLDKLSDLYNTFCIKQDRTFPS